MSSGRVPFGNQKFIYILIHFNRDCTNTVRVIYEALHEVLAITAGISGGVRIPGIGIGVLDDPFFQLLPMSPVKGCLDTILPKLEKLMSLKPTISDDSVEMLLHSSLPFIEKSVSSFSSDENVKFKLFLFTWENAEPVMSGVASYLSQCPILRLASAKVYQIVEILNEPGEGVANILGQSIQPIEASAGLQVLGEAVQADPYGIRIVFKGCLAEDEGKIPQMILTIQTQPSPRSLYFDLRESSVDINYLPSAIGSKLTLPLAGVRTTSTTTGTFIPVVEMEGIRLLTLSSLSANWHSGTLTYLIPSMAEKLSFQDFWDNSQRVAAFREHLETEEHALLCRMTSQGSIPIHAHFLIVAFGGEGLALVQLVPPELALVESFPKTPKEIPRKYRNQIEHVLGALEVTKFSVGLITSNITASLVNHLLRSSTRGTGKPPSVAASRMIRPQIRRGSSLARGATKGIAVHPCYQEINSTQARVP